MAGEHRRQGELDDGEKMLFSDPPAMAKNLLTSAGNVTNEQEKVLEAASEAVRQAISMQPSTSFTPTSSSSMDASSPNNIAQKGLGPEPADPTEAPVPSAEKNASHPAEKDTVVKAWTGSLYQGSLQISTLVVKLKNQSKGQPLSQAELDTRLEAVNAFLWHLELEAVVTPTSRDYLGSALRLLFDDRFKSLLPEDLSMWGATIYQKLESLNWGADSTFDSGNAQAEDEEDSPTTSPTTPGARSPTSEGTSAVRAPPADHPVWGINGIMHGLMMKRGLKGSIYLFDKRYKSEKRDAREFGHNGLSPGDWWPLLRVAVFHGVHGHVMAGIYGFQSEGTYSVVVSGKSTTYGDLDNDEGGVLYYSADRSHDNSDPNRVNVVTASTKSLQKSIITKRPVRVLRSAGPKKAWAPSVGVRYDGLYRVVEQQKAKNKNGGLYDRFKLVRLDGQKSLVEISRSVPTYQQKEVERQFRNGY
ncbi:E3 ubiquitin-protein ligase UHRF1 [Madurella fahalii]|uniref:E3 ubiquitin-protein ligase UHRF1 n=1 Tax=Madurella fahalii TaxID=1157608 RepID=A0ABQ0GKK2_9PEZI